MSERIPALNEPMCAVERDYTAVMQDNLMLYKEQTLITMYMRNYIRQSHAQEARYTPEELARVTDVLNVLYCELLDRNVEFVYGEE